MTFKKEHDIGESITAKPGDVFIGSFHNGKIDNGTLKRFSEDGVAGDEIRVVIGH